jgi:deoxyribose-phosphate aldolase
MNDLTSAALAKFIDHTFLKADATSRDIEKLCDEAREHRFFSVCVNGSRVREAKRLLERSTVRVAGVVGFPLGAMNSAAKRAETETVIDRGADEIDVVMNIGKLKDGDRAGVLRDLRQVVIGASGQVVKVILETCLLGREEKILACKLAVESGVQFVKTSTGFSSGGATVEDVQLMRETVGPEFGVKASGGIRDTATALAMVRAGATRLGTSSGVAIVRDLAASGSADY